MILTDERIMLIEAVIQGQLTADILNKTDLDHYQFLIENKLFNHTLIEKYEMNPTLTFSEVKNGMMN